MKTLSISGEEKMKTLKQHLQEKLHAPNISETLTNDIKLAVKECMNELRENRPSFISQDDWNIFIDEAMERMGIE